MVPPPGKWEFRPCSEKLLHQISRESNCTVCLAFARSFLAACDRTWDAMVATGVAYMLAKERLVASRDAGPYILGLNCGSKSSRLRRQEPLEGLQGSTLLDGFKPLAASFSHLMWGPKTLCYPATLYLLAAEPASRSSNLLQRTSPPKSA